MSNIWKRVNKFFIKLLNFSYNNGWFRLGIFASGIIYIVLLYSYGDSTLFKAWNWGYGGLTIMYMFGWSYDTYKDKKRIEVLEKQLNKNRYLVSKEYIKEDLADLMHEIWAENILENTHNSTKEEIDRATQVYSFLSDADKKVNRSKADKVIKLLEEYIF